MAVAVLTKEVPVLDLSQFKRGAPHARMDRFILTEGTIQAAEQMDFFKEVEGGVKGISKAIEEAMKLLTAFVEQTELLPKGGEYSAHRFRNERSIEALVQTIKDLDLDLNRTESKSMREEKVKREVRKGVKEALDSVSGNDYGDDIPLFSAKAYLTNKGEESELPSGIKKVLEKMSKGEVGSFFRGAQTSLERFDPTQADPQKVEDAINLVFDLNDSLVKSLKSESGNADLSRMYEEVDKLLSDMDNYGLFDSLGETGRLLRRKAQLQFKKNNKDLQEQVKRDADRKRQEQGKRDDLYSKFDEDYAKGVKKTGLIAKTIEKHGDDAGWLGQVLKRAMTAKEDRTPLSEALLGKAEDYGWLGGFLSKSSNKTEDLDEELEYLDMRLGDIKEAAEGASDGVSQVSSVEVPSDIIQAKKTVSDLVDGGMPNPDENQEHQIDRMESTMNQSDRKVEFTQEEILDKLSYQEMDFRNMDRTLDKSAHSLEVMDRDIEGIYLELENIGLRLSQIIDNQDISIGKMDNLGGDGDGLGLGELGLFGGLSAWLSKKVKLPKIKLPKGKMPKGMGSIVKKLPKKGKFGAVAKILSALGAGVATKEGVEAVVEQTAKKAGQSAAKEAAKEGAERVVREVSEEAASRAAKEGVEAVVEQTAKKGTEVVAKGTAKKAMGRIFGPAMLALDATQGAVDYSMAGSDAERKDVVGETVGGIGGAIAGGAAGAKAGAVAGGAIGAFFGGVGAAPGAVVGGFLGGIGGSVGGYFKGTEIGSYVSGLFHDVDDNIPDYIKDEGVDSELAYLQRAVVPSLLGDSTIGTEEKKEHLKEIAEYRDKLLASTKKRMFIHGVSENYVIEQLKRDSNYPYSEFKKRYEHVNERTFNSIKARLLKMLKTSGQMPEEVRSEFNALLPFGVSEWDKLRAEVEVVGDLKKQGVSVSPVSGEVFQTGGGMDDYVPEGKVENKNFAAQAIPSITTAIAKNSSPSTKALNQTGGDIQLAAGEGAIVPTGQMYKGRGVPDRSDKTLIDRVIQREGGYNPHDPGGGSMYGITGLTLSQWRGKKVGAKEVKSLSREEASQIYHANYLKPFGDVKDPQLKELLFDTGVNLGVGRAKKYLSEARGSGGDSKQMYEQVKKRRIGHYHSLAKSNPKKHGRWLPGWLKRMEEFNYSDDENLARKSEIENALASVGGVTSSVTPLEPENVIKEERQASVAAREQTVNEIVSRTEQTITQVTQNNSKPSRRAPKTPKPQSGSDYFDSVASIDKTLSMFELMSLGSGSRHVG